MKAFFYLPSSDISALYAHTLEFESVDTTWPLQNRCFERIAIIQMLKRTGLLHRGVLNRRMRISTLETMKFVDHTVYQGVAYGCVSWDQTLHDLLLVVLLFATAAHIGDFIRSEGYTGKEYLQYRHCLVVIAEAVRPWKALHFASSLNTLNG